MCRKMNSGEIEVIVSRKYEEYQAAKGKGSLFNTKK